MQVLYTILYALGFVLLSPLFVYKMWKRGKYRENFFQRFGRYSPELRQQLATKTRPRCWIQAVSVGEVNLTLTFLAAFRQRFPQYQLILSTTTSTGYALARERLPNDVVLLYFPQDFPFSVRRAYNLITPDCLILMESEVWPNHIWEGARRGLPIFLVNARSARGYRRLPWFFRSVFSQYTLVCAQSDDDAGNFRALGVPADRVHMTGNLKYDASLPQAGTQPFDPAAVLKQLGLDTAQPILVAGSTHPGEEEILFDLLPELRSQFPDLFLVLVPRHVERTPEIVELARRKNITLALRKNAPPPATKPDCLLVNTTGELKWFYSVATVIFVGKSLVGEGGQNIVEAAASGHPVVFGPNMQNFKAIAAQFVAEGAGVQVPDVAAFRQALIELLAEPTRREVLAAAARRVIAANVGATARTLDLIAQSLMAGRRQ
jgi:3-deoxy-D-manno-octulosonic-acid transferase